jgi:hypothetical protein
MARASIEVPGELQIAPPERQAIVCCKKVARVLCSGTIRNQGIICNANNADSNAASAGINLCAAVSPLA